MPVLVLRKITLCGSTFYQKARLALSLSNDSNTGNKRTWRFFLSGSVLSFKVKKKFLKPYDAGGARILELYCLSLNPSLLFTDCVTCGRCHVLFSSWNDTSSTCLTELPWGQNNFQCLEHRKHSINSHYYYTTYVLFNGHVIEVQYICRKELVSAQLTEIL